MKLVLVLAVTLMVTACSSTPINNISYSEKCESYALSIMNFTHDAANHGAQGKDTRKDVYQINMLVYLYNNKKRCTEITGMMSYVDVTIPEIEL
jgi:hypothetical protein